MERVVIRDKVISFLKEYRYVALVLIIGLFLMLLPQGMEEEAGGEAPAPVETVSTPELQESLGEILSQIQGAGKVTVLLTQARGEEILYQTDGESSSDSIHQDTVILTDSEKKQEGLIRQTLPPTYLGAIVVCQGGDSPAIRLAIIEAVSDVTGLTSDKITVLKMK